MKPILAVASCRALLPCLFAIATLGGCDREIAPTGVRPWTGKHVVGAATLSGPVGIIETTDLGTLGGPESRANAISADGKVTGWSSQAAGEGHAFLLLPNQPMIDLGTLGGGSEGYGVNAAAEVAGVSATGDGRIKGFRWRNGSMTNIEYIGGYFSSAYAINESGVLAGFSLDWNSTFLPIHWDDANGFTVLGSLGGGYGFAYGINSAGTTVGWSFTLACCSRHAFVWSSSGGMSEIPGATAGAEARAINDVDQIVGFNGGTGYLWSNGTTTVLGSLGGGQTMPLAINDLGQVVGWSTTSAGRKHAFLWQGGTMTDLSGNTGPESEAHGINDDGVVVGWSKTPTGAMRATRWVTVTNGVTPVGSNVTVQPTDATTGQAAPISLSFSSVISSGQTSVTSSTVGQGGAPSPTGFRLGSPATYYNITTTATFAGSINLCLNYSSVSYGNENQLKLLHYANNAWVDVTTSLNTSTNIICGAVTSLSPFLVAELNISPVIRAVSLPTNPIPIGATAVATSSFTDENALDIHTTTFAWEDGSSSAGSVTESSGAGSAVGSHVYTLPGVYTITATVSDGSLSDNRSSAIEVPAYVVVYDPSTGFVTGGGWIDSPVGACRLDSCDAAGTTTGKGSFGFVARYAKGPSAAVGETEFQFNAGNLNFHSTSYQWLVIAGDRAQYKGVGQISGSSADFGFFITAIDGALTGSSGADRFRIKIWDRSTGAVVYDNQMGSLEDSPAATALSGGSIVIKKK